MYAIVKIGGNQYKVAPEETVTVAKLPGTKTGESLKFPALMVVDGSNIKIGKEAAATDVSATVMSHEKGEKINTLRFRAKSRHRRRHGLRVQVTKLKINAIGAGRTTAEKTSEKLTTSKSAPEPSRTRPAPRTKKTVK